MNTAPSRHIIIIGPVYPYRGGIAHFSETMWRGLQARGHTVSAVTFSRQYPELLFPGKTQYESGSSGLPEVAPRRIDSINPLTWRGAARAIATQQPNAVVFQHWMPFFAPAYGVMARYLRKRGIRVLVVVHNALPHERRPGDKALSRYFFKACDGFIALSKAVEQELRDLGVQRPIQQEEHPIYDLFGEAPEKADARKQLGLDPEAPVMLFFGFIRRYKGLHILLDALPHVVSSLSKVKLVVAGEFYDEESSYREQIQQHGLNDHVIIQSAYIPKEHVGLYFSAADVVVQPYVSATQSGVAQIAFHFDRPVIVTDIGGLAEVVPHEQAGLVVPPEDPKALAKSIIRFFREDMGSRLQEGVRTVKQSHSWDRIYDAVETLLTDT